MVSLITGIRGFIAGHLAKDLIASGETVVGAGRRPPSEALTELGVRFVTCDVTDAAKVYQVINAVKPDTVYHLAANAVLQAAAGGGGTAAMIATNALGTLSVLEASRAVGVGVCVIACSDKQYGALAQPPYDDEDTTAFLNGGVYELSKAQQDQYGRIYAGLYDVPAVRIARLINIYGPGDTQWTRIVPGTIRRTWTGESPRLTSGPAGAALREYLYVDDAVHALRQLAKDAATRGNAPCRILEGKLARVGYNIGPGARLAATDVIAGIQSVMAAEFGVTGLPPVVTPGTSGIFEPGSQYSRTERIGALCSDVTGEAFAPRSFEDGLRATIPWYLDYLKQNPAA